MRKGSNGQRMRTAMLVLAVAAAGLAEGARAQDALQPLRNVGDGYKSVRVISKYDLNPETRTMDLVAADPNDNSISRETRVDIATQTVHEICANRVIPGGWTIRIFLPGDPNPVASCKAGSAKAPPTKKHSSRRGNG